MSKKRLPNRGTTSPERDKRLVSEIRRFMDGQKIRGLSPTLVKDEASVRTCLQELLGVVNGLDDSGGDLGNSIALLSQAYWNARLSWEQVASILRSGLQYAKLYRYLFKGATEDIEAVVGSPGGNFVQLLTFMAAVRDRTAPLKPPPQYAKTSDVLLYRSQRGNRPIDIADSPVADQYEENLRHSRAFTEKVLCLTNDLPISFWLYEAIRDWFVPCTPDYNFWEEAATKPLDDVTHFLLRELCSENDVAVLGVHPFGTKETKTVEVQVHRVRVQRQHLTGPYLVLIPGYYQASHIKKNANTDFIDLYGCMSGVPKTRPTRESKETKKALARQYMDKLIAGGIPPYDAWHAARKKMNWSPSTAIRYLGAEPTQLHVPRPIEKLK
jgi:hypothetical protein